MCVVFGVVYLFLLSVKKGEKGAGGGGGDVGERKPESKVRVRKAWLGAKEEKS